MGRPVMANGDDGKVIPMHGRMPLNKLRIPDPTTIPPRPWLYGYWLMRGAVTLLAAPGGTGKTGFVTTMILGCATGRELLGARPLGRLRVALLGLEESEEETHRRFAAAMIHHDIPIDEVNDQILYLDGRDYGFLAAYQDEIGQVQPTSQMIELETWLSMSQIDVLFADPLALMHSAQENDNTAMAGVLRLFAELAGRLKMGICLIHHTRKGAIAGDQDSIRGAGALVNHARIALGLSQMDKASQEQFGIDDESAKRLIKIDDLKMNYSARCADARWLKLESVDLNNPSPEYPYGDSVQVVDTWVPPAPTADLTVSDANMILDELNRGDDNGDRYTLAGQSPRSAKNLIVRLMAAKGTDKSEKWAKGLLNLWEKNKVIYQDNFTSPGQRHKRKGIFVNKANRPGNRYE